ncbi:MAG TPA: hypothetical protein VKX17_09900 [Planctomycetota bacterium]|nr:hypothetical protein [Planctomycetota bacterium]
MKYKLSISHNSASDSLDVMLRADVHGFDGSVCKTIGRDDYTVGIGKDGTPYYIHMADAENADAIFNAVHTRLKQGQKPGQADQDHIAQVAHTLMLAVAYEYQKKTWMSAKKDFQVELCA